ncbi:hypothetical protein PMAYCL1PPCAC_04999, partial [Pristionchus mayeri]
PVELNEKVFEDFTHSIHNPQSDVYIKKWSEKKEDSMEFKDEQIDEFCDIKHEEPIADVFCPSTGTSRPLYKTNIRSTELEEAYRVYSEV